jgi:hypothetical protein
MVDCLKSIQLILISQMMTLNQTNRTTKKPNNQYHKILIKGL